MDALLGLASVPLSELATDVATRTGAEFGREAAAAAAAAPAAAAADGGSSVGGGDSSVGGVEGKRGLDAAVLRSICALTQLDGDSTLIRYGMPAAALDEQRAVKGSSSPRVLAAARLSTALAKFGNQGWEEDDDAGRDMSYLQCQQALHAVATDPQLVNAHREQLLEVMPEVRGLMAELGDELRSSHVS